MVVPEEQVIHTHVSPVVLHIMVHLWITVVCRCSTILAEGITMIMTFDYRFRIMYFLLKKDESHSVCKIYYLLMI